MTTEQIATTTPLLSDSIHALGHGEAVLHTIRDDAGSPLAAITVAFAVRVEGPRYEVRMRLGQLREVDWDASGDFFSPHTTADFAYRAMRDVLEAE